MAEENPIAPGALYVVATPIGNLADVTLRALFVLRAADVLLAEDTRRTRNLLVRHGIERKVLSCHEHNEKARAGLVRELLSKGKSVALVSDAGTPAVSDPGFAVVAAAAAAGHPVFAVPGPCAVSAAVSASGFPCDSFFFAGFPPRKKSERDALLQRAAGLPCASVFYESPNRACALVSDLAALCPDRPAVLFRELTKVHEEAVRGSLAQIAQELYGREQVKGEIVLVVDAGKPGCEPASEEALVRAIEEGLARDDLSPSQLAAEISRKLSWPRKEVYHRILAARREP